MEPFPANPDALHDPVTLLDEQGTAWVLHSRRVDLRVVRRLVKDATTTVVWADMGGIRPRPTTGTARSALWDRIKNDYRGPGGSGSPRGPHRGTGGQPRADGSGQPLTAGPTLGCQGPGIIRCLLAPPQRNGLPT
jgi:hypothetical protein